MTHEFSNFFFWKINDSDDKLISARNFLGWMVLLLCDCKSWSSLANQLYHQSNDETERSGKMKNKRKREKNRRIGEELILVYVVEDFPIFLLLSLLIHFYSIGGYGWPYWMERSNMCSFKWACVYVCACAHYFQFNSTHGDERNINEKTSHITFVHQTFSHVQ